MTTITTVCSTTLIRAQSVPWRGRRSIPRITTVMVAKTPMRTPTTITTASATAPDRRSALGVHCLIGRGRPVSNRAHLASPPPEAVMPTGTAAKIPARTSTTTTTALKMWTTTARWLQEPARSVACSVAPMATATATATSSTPSPSTEHLPDEDGYDNLDGTHGDVCPASGDEDRYGDRFRIGPTPTTPSPRT